MPFLLRCALALPALLLLLAAPARSDEVKLKSGRVVKGLIAADNGKTVRIETADGKVEVLKHDDIESVSESAELGSDEIDAKLKDVDVESGEAVAETAKWAKEAGIKGWRLAAKLALKKDATNDVAHELLGHEKIGDTWYSNKADADKARKELAEKEYKEKGYVKWKDGWIRKEDKPIADKDPKAFEKDPTGLFRDRATVMKEKGFVQVGGKWIRGGTDEDRTDMARFKELMGDEIWAVTTKHYRVFAQQYPPEKVDEFCQLIEKTHDWFIALMGKDPEFDVFGGHRGAIWILKDKGTALDWYRNYKTKYSLDAGGGPSLEGSTEKKSSFLTLIEQSGGNVNASQIRISLVVPSQNEDIRNQLVHSVGHHHIFWFSNGLKRIGPADWLEEAFAHQAEHAMLGNGAINCSTLAKYGNAGGVQEKNFTTKDAPERAKGLYREGAETIDNINKLGLNELSGDHLTKGWTLIDALLREKRQALINFLELLNTSEFEAALRGAFDGWGPADIDKYWREKVKGAAKPAKN